MTQVADENYLILTHHNQSNKIELEFDDSNQVEYSAQQCNQIQNEEDNQTLFNVLNKSYEVESQNPEQELYETTEDMTNENWDLSQDKMLNHEDSSILEERLSDYEDHYVEERLSDYESHENMEFFPETSDHHTENTDYNTELNPEEVHSDEVHSDGVHSEGVCSEEVHSEEVPSEEEPSEEAHSKEVLIEPRPPQLYRLPSKLPKPFEVSNTNFTTIPNLTNSQKSPKILNFSLSKPNDNNSFELPIIRKAPIIITSKHLSNVHSAQSKILNTRKILTQALQKQAEHFEIKNTNLELKNNIAKTFRVVTSSKTLTNSVTLGSPKTVITKNQNIKTSTGKVLNKEVCIQKENKNGTNYDSDSEVLFGFANNDTNQRKSVSALDFDSFEKSMNSTINSEAPSKSFTDSEVSISEKSTTIVKVPSKSINYSKTPNFGHLQNQIIKTGDRTVMTKILPRFVSETKNTKNNDKDAPNKATDKNEPSEEIRSKRTSEEMNVAMALQKLIEPKVIKEPEEPPVKKRYLRKLSKAQACQEEKNENLSEEQELKFALAKFFMECNIPLGVVEDSSFKEFVRLLKPDFVPKMPGSKELLQTILKL